MEKELIKGKFTKVNVVPYTLAGIALILLFILLAEIEDDGYRAMRFYNAGPYLLIALVVCLIAAVVTWFYFGNCAITVTDKRVICKAAFGKRVDLPFDMISSVGTKVLMGICVATSSGVVSCFLCANRTEVFNVISEQLLLRQEKGKSFAPAAEPRSAAAELKEFKDLLDSGVITQEEFDEKKKQLLGK